MNKKKVKIAIMGGAGFLGTKLKDFLSERYDVVSSDRDNELAKNRVDASNLEEVRKFLIREKPEIIIDCIALTSSLECEKNPALAKLLNYQTAKNIADVATELKASMIFISSSYVFDGKSGNYSEEDAVNPLSEYGKTKIMAEKEILSLDKGIVIRVDLMYGYNKKGKNGVFDRILSGKDIEIGDPDQLRQPVLADEVARFIDFIITKKQYGIFHVAGKERVKIVEFLGKLEKIIRKESKIKLVDKKPEVLQPKNATLNVNKIESMGFNPKSIEESLRILKNQL